MPKFFIDTSALVKFFVVEPGTEKVEQIILNEENTLFISTLSILEFSSALFKKYRTNEINEDQLKLALEGFEESLYLFEILSIDNNTFNNANSLIKKLGKDKGLRTLDAIQLSAFELLNDKGITMVNADSLFCSILESLMYKVINPLQS